MLWTAACMLRNRWAEPGDLKRCSLRSRRRTTWCEFSARLFCRKSLLMVTGKPEVLEGSAVGPQLIRRHPFRREALLSHQLAHEPDGSAPISPALNQDVEDLAFVIDGAPEIHPLARDPDDHLVEMPSIARPRTALPQPPCDHRAEFQHPAAHALVGDVEPALGQQFLDVAVAERET